MSKRRSDAVHKENETPQEEKETPTFESVRKIIGLVSAGAGIFAALLYLAGRSFASGYFEAMNIPSYQVSFSLWEYGEVAWFPMVFYSAVLLGGSSLLWAIIFGMYDVFFSKLGKNIKIKHPSWLKLQFSRNTKHWFLLFLFSVLALSFLLLVDNTLQIVRTRGQQVGQTILLENAAQVELVSANPMALDDDSQVPAKASGQDYYTYKKFYLLTINNGKYYLFKEVDPETCKPAKVYVIEARESVQVNLLPAVSLADQCKMTNVVTTPTGSQTTP